MKEKSAPPRPIFRLDRLQKELTADGVTLKISPKSTDLLLFLVENAGRVVTRADLVNAVWGGLSVSNDAVRYAMKALRRALGDPAAEPLFIETVAHRGWRFVGRAARVSAESWILESRATEGSHEARRSAADTEPFVGREAEMGRLQEVLSRVQAGERRTIFVRGEPGIGKSRLLAAFLETAGLRRDTFTARGECIEQIGPGMPYSPLFQVLEQICTRLGDELPLAMLRQHAPTWLSQMPSLTEPADRASLEDQLQGATQTRMIREWANVVERFALDRTIVIAIEDLQWADPSTLSALFFIARRVEPARVMIVATLRPEASTTADIDLQGSVDELVGRASCQLMSPSTFEPDSIRAYLGSRFGQDQRPCHSDDLCEYLSSASAGNPLYLVSLVDECVEAGRIHQRDGLWSVTTPLELDSVPANLTPVIARQLGALEPDLRAALEAASIVGMDFSASELSAALESPIDEVESLCDNLVADGRFVSARGAVAWPDGTVSSAYRFMHGLHRDVLRELLSPGRRSRLHRAVGERLRSAFAGREEEIAPKLAMHFEAGLDLASAAGFLTLAGEASAKRLSNYEAVEHFRHALDLMNRIDFEGRRFLEIRTRLAFCAPLASVAGYAAYELEQNLDRLETLTANIEDSAETFPALLGLWSLNFVRADLDRAAVLGNRMLALADREASGALRLQAHQSAGHCLFYRGQVQEAQNHYDLATDGYDISAHPRQDYSVGDDPVVLVLACQALSDWFLGRADEACRSADEAVRQGERLEHPPSLALAWTYGAVLHQLRDDVTRARKWSDRALEITNAEGIPFWMELSRIVRGWSVARAEYGSSAEGIELIREGISGWGATGSNLGLPHFLSLLAASLGRAAEIEEGLKLLGDARRLMEETGQWVFQSQIDRLTGELIERHAEANRDEAGLERARSFYAQAVDEAESRGLKANALQASMALAGMSNASPQAKQRLDELVALYPPNASMDLHLTRARQLLSD